MQVLGTWKLPTEQYYTEPAAEVPHAPTVLAATVQEPAHWPTGWAPVVNPAYSGDDPSKQPHPLYSHLRQPAPKARRRARRQRVRAPQARSEPSGGNHQREHKHRCHHVLRWACATVISFAAMFTGLTVLVILMNPTV